MCCNFIIISFNNFSFFFLKIIIPIEYSHKDSMQSYKSFYFSMLLIDDITDLEKPDRIYSPTIVVDEFSELFLNPSVLSSKYSRSA